VTVARRCRKLVHVARRVTVREIKLLRQAAGLRQQDLAAAIGIDRSFLSRLEAGSRRLRPELAARIVRALGAREEAKPVNTFDTADAAEAG